MAVLSPPAPRIAVTGERRAQSRDTITTARTALTAGLTGAAALIAITAPFMSRYGWDRDELYFRSAAHHLALGYVDFPPLIALAGRIVDALAPHSLVALRIVSLACGAATVVLVAFIARELGGGRRAQWIASLSWALTPYILSSAGLFHPTWLDALAWVAFLYVAVRMLVRDDPRLWLALGLIAGIGLEAKYTIGFLVIGFVAALALTRERRQLGGAWPWIGLAAAVVLVAPNLVWQIQHGWPSADFLSSQNAKTASDTPPLTYIAEQVLFLGATGVVAVAGAVWLWRRRLRALALVPVLITAVFLIERGRAYYPLPADALAVAAGAIAVDGWLRGRRGALIGAGLITVQLAVIALAGPIVVPFYSTRQLVSSNVWETGFFKDEIGWPELTAQVTRDWMSLSPADRTGGVVLAMNYGEASALELYGRGLGPVLSGHLSWQYWRPDRLPQRFALTVGYSEAGLRALCAAWRPLSRIDNRWHLGNEERGRLIAACVLRRPLGAIWSRSIASDRL